MNKRDGGQTAKPARPVRRRGDVVYARGEWIKDEKPQQNQQDGKAGQVGDDQQTTAQQT